ncbi:MAG: hypothetical protein CFE24_04055 [Flavobacterium sp. BFFFF2]|nr:MAG: hypothetical protein CFE24_04055 [Flavobacterium sp. BFFFF2]
MDTDELSVPTYDGIIRAAEKFNHNLTLQFGVLASNCKDDDDYLNQAEAIINQWLQMDQFEEIIDDIFFGESVSQEEFINTLNKISSNIAEVRITPMEQREYEDWG